MKILLAILAFAAILYSAFAEAKGHALIDRDTYGTFIGPPRVLDHITTQSAAEQLAIAKPDPGTYPVLPGERHFCPICVPLKLKSKVYSKAACAVTATSGCTQPYWDENGYRQAPIPCNVKSCSYTCSQGHTWTEIENVP